MFGIDCRCNGPDHYNGNDALKFSKASVIRAIKLSRADALVRVGPPGPTLPPHETELQRCRRLKPPACLAINRHHSGTDVIDPSMQSQIALFQSSGNRRM